MLPAVNRFKGKENFVRIKKLGKLYHSQSFSLLVYQRNDTEPVKIGFVVSNKVSKLAIVRNKIKRLLRETVGSNLDSLNTGWDMVFLANRQILDRSRKDLQVEVDQAFVKLQLRDK